MVEFAVSTGLLGAGSSWAASPLAGGVDLLERRRGQRAQGVRRARRRW